MTDPPSDARPLALVTGASSGIGAAFARRLAADGYDLILVARRRERLDAVAREAAASGARAEVLAADLAEDAGLRAVEARIAAAEGLELLVNNAGFGTVGRFFEADRDEQVRMHRLHVLATVRLTHAALAVMAARGKGAVVNVSSVAAFGQNVGNASYCATKAWMNSFTEGVALDLRSAGLPITVQALCPGFTLTGFHPAMGVDRAAIPARWWTTAEDVVDASLRGLARGTLIVVPGLRYKVYALLLRIMPRELMDALAVRYGKRFRPSGQL